MSIRPVVLRRRMPEAAALCATFGLYVAAPLTLGGCAMQCQENFSLLRQGMTKGEVESLLGAPSSRWPGERPGEEGTERWQYGDNLSSLATSGVFHEADQSRVYVVWFAADGTVDRFVEPDWARGTR